MNSKELKELEKIKKQSLAFEQSMTAKIDNLCNKLNYVQGSRLSRVGDRLKLFINELNEI